MAHGDYTGQRKAVLAQEYHEQQQLAAQSQTLVTQVVRQGRDEVIRLWNDRDDENLALAEQVAAGGDSEDGVVQVGVVNSQDVERYKPVRFRASEDLDDITVGQGRQFSLKGMRVYEAPRWVVEHLDTQGLVYH